MGRQFWGRFENVCRDLLAVDQGSISPMCLCAAFMRVDPKNAKKTVKSSIIVLLGSACQKAARKMLVYLTSAVALCASVF